MVTGVHLDIPLKQIFDFCQRWLVSEFSLFGSVIRDDFRNDSDVDVLVSFAANAQWSLYDWVDMKEELEAIFTRPVDLVSKAGLRNPFRRRAILNNRRIIYAA
jgi:hypothetical protein